MYLQIRIVPCILCPLPGISFPTLCFSSRIPLYVLFIYEEILFCCSTNGVRGPGHTERGASAARPQHAAPSADASSEGSLAAAGRPAGRSPDGCWQGREGVLPLSTPSPCPTAESPAFSDEAADGMIRKPQTITAWRPV